MGSILIIEGYHNLATFYKNIFEEDGHSVVVVPNGKEAIHVASEKHFDVVIVEDRLSDFKTEELLNQLQLIQPHIQGIICTLTDFFAQPQTDLCSENIQKSQNFTILQESVNRVLHKSSC